MIAGRKRAGGVVLVVCLASAACTGGGAGVLGGDSPTGAAVAAPVAESEVSSGASDVMERGSEVSQPDVSVPVPGEIASVAGTSGWGDRGVVDECGGVEEACGFVSVSVGAMSVGASGACGLRAVGDVDCWGGSGPLLCVVEAGEAEMCGEIADGSAMSPEGTFVAVDTGPGYSCGVRAGGALACWGRFHDVRGREGLSELLSPPVGAFTAVSASRNMACGVRVGGRVTCWVGAESYHGDSRLVPPEDLFVSVSVALDSLFACGVRVDGRISCWVADAGPIVDSLPREFRSTSEARFESVSAGLWYFCGIRADATVECQGDHYFYADRPPEGEFVSVDTGAGFACGVRTDGEVACWGIENRVPCENETWCLGWDLFPGSAPEGPFTSVSVAPDRFWSATICGLRVGGELVCWNEEAVFHRPPVGSFVALDAGGGEACEPRSGGRRICWDAGAACGVRSGGGMRCWGAGASDWSPPDGAYVSVSVGSAHACGLLVGGEVACWGDDHVRDASPGGAFTAVSAGTDFSCGLRLGGEVVCWGSNADWRASPPPGRFASISAAGGFACGLRADREVVCWGDDSASASRCRSSTAWRLDSDQCRSDGRGGRVTPPPGPFASISVAEGYACGLRPDGEMVCWGDNRGDRGLVPPALSGSVAAIRAHPGTLCALRGDGSVDCLDSGGERLYRALWSPVAPAGTFTAVAAGHLHACGIRPDRTVECWSPRWPPGAGVPDARFGDPRLIVEAPDGDREERPLAARGVPWTLEWVLEEPQGRFDALAVVDADITCGRHLDGSVDCWGSWPDADPPRSVLSPDVVSADAAYYSSCWVRTDGTICRRAMSEGGLLIEGAFVDVGVGFDYACALGDGGDVVCWGANQYGQSTPTPPPWMSGPPYRALAVGHSHACALRTDGDAVCWGDNRWGQTDAPSDSLTAITAGHLHTCGLRGDGEVVCWGDDLHGQTQSPEGVFTWLGAGQWHTCGLRGDGEVVCWGDGVYTSGSSDFIDPPPGYPTEPPAGPFSSLAVGEWHSCALRPDGTAACWLSY